MNKKKDTTTQSDGGSSILKKKIATTQGKAHKHIEQNEGKMYSQSNPVQKLFHSFTLPLSLSVPHILVAHTCTSSFSVRFPSTSDIYETIVFVLLNFQLIFFFLFCGVVYMYLQILKMYYALQYSHFSYINVYENAMQ